MLISQAQLEWVKPPRQARSQQTLERLLDAAEAIIDDSGIDSATVAEIARRAGSSVGAFYSRFADKEGLMRCVFERFNEQALATSDAILVPQRWEGVPVTDALENVVMFMLTVLREKRALILAMVARAGEESVSALNERLLSRITSHMRTVIEHRGEKIHHPDPDAALRLAVWMVLAGVESRTIHGAHDEQTTDSVIAAELARMALGYLGIESKHGLYAPVT